MKIYTRTGDSGSTGLFGGPRVSKDDPRIEAYGTVDELNAVLGVTRSQDLSDEIDGYLHQIQCELFAIGAELATPNPAKHDMQIINQAHIDRLEQWIDVHEAKLEPLRQFILPGGVSAASHLHMARGVCRRAERRVISMASCEGYEVSEPVIVYLNRLSDLLFVLSRSVNHAAGAKEFEWNRPD